MFRKNYILLLVSLTNLFLAESQICFAGKSADLNHAEENVYKLINEDKIAEARSAVDKLAADFGNEPDLPEAIYWIAERYERTNRFEETKPNYQRIIQNYPSSPWAEKARLGISRTEAMSLVMSRKFDKAKEAINKMTDDFAGNTDVAEAIYWTAERFGRFDRYEDAKEIYQKIVQKFPKNQWAEKARMCIARADAMMLVTAQEFSRVNAAIDKMTVDFAAQPELPMAVYWITERFERSNRFEDAKRNYQRIIQNYPNSYWAEKARLSVSKSEAMAFIASEKFDMAQIAIDKMSVDFAGNSDLPGAIYWTAAKFEPANRFEELKKNYQALIKNYPGSFYAEKARLGISQAEVISHIRSGDYDEAKKSLNEMSVEFAGNDGLPNALYWLTERYEWANKYDEAKSVYQQIIQNHPDNPYADKAKLGIRRVDLMVLMESPDARIAEEALDKMTTDFKDNPELPRAVFLIGAKCFLEAKLPDSSQRAIKIVEKVLQELPKTPEMAGMYEEVYCCAGDCCFDMNDNTKALSYYKKLADESPEHRLSPRAQFRMGEIYKRLSKSGLMSASEAQTKMHQAYEQLLLRKPNSEYANSAKNWFNQNESGTDGQK